MILTNSQANAVAALMKDSHAVSFEMPAPSSSVERVKVVHERNYSPKVLVWQTIGGVAHNEETYADRDAFLSAYGLG